MILAVVAVAVFYVGVFLAAVWAGSKVRP